MIRKLAVVALAALAPFAASATTVSLDLGRSVDLLQNVPFQTITFEPVPVAFGGGLVSVSAFGTRTNGFIPQRLVVTANGGLSIDGGLSSQPDGEERVIDPPEFLRFDFTTPVTGVTVGVNLAGGPTGGGIGSRFVEVFSPEGALIANVLQDRLQTFTSDNFLAPDTLISALIVRAVSGNFRINRLGFTLQQIIEPEPPVVIEPPLSPPTTPVAAVPLPPAAPLLLAALAGLGLVSRLSVRRSGPSASRIAATPSSVRLRAPSRPAANGGARRG
ncbi:MAG: hypothetical protein ACE37J_06440 [Pikeienuella sp.]|uniref:hypothetical protein n=1 Tax=Pikeienuella sp. TaxID=2831957 RepID=UPI00391BA58A